jgi:hypothetical protein
MTARNIAESFVTSLLLVLLVPAGPPQVHAGESSLKDKADYNKSVAAVLGGVSQVKNANAHCLKAVGEYLHKLATISQLQEQIRKEKMANDMKSVENFYAKKKMHNDYHSNRGPKRLSAERYRELARERKPARLTAAQITPVSSRINWPHRLRSDCFDQNRAEVERLWAERTVQNSGIGSQNHTEIECLVAQMKKHLKQRIHSMSPMDYLAAKKFLNGLALESRFVAGAELEAVASK